MSSFGAYDECINTIVPSKRSGDKGNILFRGQYCTIDFRPPLPPMKNFYKLDEVLDDFKNFSKGDTVLSEAAKISHFFYFLTLRIGICVPSGCSLEDINQLASKLFSSFYLDAHASRCEIKQEEEYPPKIIFVMFVYCLAGFFMLIGSLIDLYCYYTKASFK
ncbi:uncharacterized protein, partial [Parasteatoda tepidariorum]|uniref:uncharacterized protein n=1 Tax=Parasteatoda tepidariorum TaxID=114398 RepID=UPI0039BCF017